MGSLLIILAAIIAVIMALRSGYPWFFLAKLARNMLLSLVVLCVLGMIGQIFSFHLPINLPAVLILAILGLPGLGLLVVLNFLLV